MPWPVSPVLHFGDLHYTNRLKEKIKISLAVGHGLASNGFLTQKNSWYHVFKTWVSLKILIINNVIKFEIPYYFWPGLW